MASKTFSSRADEEKLRVADAVARRDAGMSFGQFCGTQVVEYVYVVGKLPPIEPPAKVESGIHAMLELAKKHGVSDVSRMSDAEIDGLLAARYE